MSAKASYKVIVLFEDEVRIAAKLLHRFFEPARDLTSAEAVDIIKACVTALQGAEDDDCVLLLGRKPVATPAGSKP